MEKNYASLQQRVGDPIETCKAQNVSMEEKINELSVMYDDLEQYTTKLIYIYGRCQYIQCSLWLEILPLQRQKRSLVCHT